jgi:hypothetical protein
MPKLIHYVSIPSKGSKELLLKFIDEPVACSDTLLEYFMGEIKIHECVYGCE